MSYGSQKNKRSVARSKRRESGDISFIRLLKTATVGVLIACLCTVLLSVLFSALCLIYPDPIKLTTVVGLVVMYLSSAAGGVFSGIKLRRDKQAALFGGALCGFGVFVTFGIVGCVLSFLPMESHTSFHGLFAILMRSLSVFFALIGAYMGVRRKYKPRRAKK